MNHVQLLFRKSPAAFLVAAPNLSDGFRRPKEPMTATQTSIRGNHVAVPSLFRVRVHVANPLKGLFRFAKICNKSKADSGSSDSEVSQSQAQAEPTCILWESFEMSRRFQLFREEAPAPRPGSQKSPYHPSRRQIPVPQLRHTLSRSCDADQVSHLRNAKSGADLCNRTLVQNFQDTS
jgi:hypothetical protein